MCEEYVLVVEVIIGFGFVGWRKNIGRYCKLF